MSPDNLFFLAGALAIVGCVGLISLAFELVGARRRATERSAIHAWGLSRYEVLLVVASLAAVAVRVGYPSWYSSARPASSATTANADGPRRSTAPSDSAAKSATALDHDDRPQKGIDQ
jgi:hypothetical protein